MLSYEELKARLDENIAIMEEKIAIIDDLRANKKKHPTTEQEKVLNSGKPSYPEEIALMLQAKSNARAEHGIDYQPVLIKDEEGLSKLKAIVQQNFHSKKPFHYDLIIQTTEEGRERGIHCTPLQIDSDGDNIKLFHIDSVGSRNLVNFWSILAVADSIKVDTNLYYDEKGGTQQDKFSCSAFSIQDLNTMSNLGAKSLSQYLPPSESNDKRTMSALHPRFVKNAQSSAAIRENLTNEENKTVIVSKNKTIEQHVEDYSITVAVAEQATGKVIEKKQNRAIDYKTLKYLKSARDELERIYQKGGEELVQKIITQRTGGIIFTPRPIQELTKANKYKIMQSTKDILTNHQDIISFNKEMDQFIDQLTVDKIGKQANDQDKQQIRERVEAKLEKIIEKSSEKDIFRQALDLMRQKDSIKDIGNVMHSQKHGNDSNKATSLLRTQQAKYKAEYRNSI
ncbi:MAG: hypothetical protein LN568_06365 [Rickettsia endosymbiont of Pseudomimeciton antennatum]|nr:hypothetical protein [Rickettsia endosymbiont of Pseudomimeciton antennatum]MCC8397731.1 hypothetical protein [Rickettsia endosymbiont of Labidopullus appendiculatus]